MTRQNQIPTEDGSRVTLALIPLWDMCNPTNGLITTGYNLEDDRCECVALQDFQAGDQVGFCILAESQPMGTEEWLFILRRHWA